MKKIILILVTIAISFLLLITILRNVFPKFNSFFLKISNPQNISDISKFILLNQKGDSTAIAFDDLAVVIEKGEIKFYNKWLNKIAEFNIQIQNPIYHVNQKYLIIADRGGKKVYTFKRARNIEEKLDFDLDLPIDAVFIDDKGSALVQTKNNLYKGILSYIENNKEKFKIFVTSGIISSMDIQKKAFSNEKELALSIVECNNAKISSNIKIYRLNNEKAELLKEIPIDDMVTNIKYKMSGNLLIQAQDTIYTINKDKNFEKKELFKADENTKAINIYGSENYAIIKSEKDKRDSKIKGSLYIYNEVLNTEQFRYSFDTDAKEIYVNSNRIIVRTQDQFVIFSTRGSIIRILPFTDELKNYEISQDVAIFQFLSKLIIIGI